MKKLILALVMLIIANYLFSQSPQSFSYQAVVRNDLGAVIENQNVGIKIDIHQSSASGTAIYSESHAPTTNAFGLINIEVGTGSVLSGTFAGINWGADSYFIEISLDQNGGTSYQSMGTSQLLSVPYSLYSQSSGDSSLWELNGNTVYYNAGNVGIGAITPNGKLLVQSDASAGVNDDIFSVLNANGDTVFAVYQEGVRIYVDDNGGTKANGSRGGFAVGGFSPTKAGFTNEYLRVTPDSVRVYINDDYVGTKANGSRGGFAVGGFSPTKGLPTNDYLFVQDDSTRIYTGDTTSGFGVENINSSGGSSTSYMHLTPNNYLIGHRAGDSLTTGLYNLFCGYESGISTLSGSNNIFMGYNAGYYNTIGEDNVFLGSNAGFSNDTGSYNSVYGNLAAANARLKHANVIIGNGSGYQAHNSMSNVMIGYDSGADSYDSYASIMIGNRSGENAHNDTSNVMVGVLSGRNAYNSRDNIMIGVESGESANDSRSNVFIGSNSGRYASNDTACVVIGIESGRNADSCKNTVLLGFLSGLNANNLDNCVMLGSSAGENAYNCNQSVMVGMSTGSEANNCSGSIIMGFGAGRNAANSGHNVMIGHFAGSEAANAQSSVMIGDFCGVNNITWKNTFVGSNAAQYNTSGSFNAAYGSSALQSNTTASNNTAIGAGSLLSQSYDNGNTEWSSDNTAVGASALYYNQPTSTSNGINNTAIGSWALRDNTTGYNNTGIGRESGFSNSTGYGNIFIGYRAGFGETGSNKLYIQNSMTGPTNTLIYGEFDTEILRFNANVGIGTSDFGNGSRVLALSNGSFIPFASITDGVLLYSEDVAASSELKVRDEAGNVTTLSPHNFSITEKSEPMAWSFYSENNDLGYKINVDMLKTVRAIEQLSGEKLVYIQDLNTQETITQSNNSESIYEIVEKQSDEIEYLKAENKQLKEKLDQIIIMLEKN